MTSYSVDGKLARRIIKDMNYESWVKTNAGHPHKVFLNRTDMSDEDCKNVIELTRSLGVRFDFDFLIRIDPSGIVGGTFLYFKNKDKAMEFKLCWIQ